MKTLAIALLAALPLLAACGRDAAPPADAAAASKPADTMIGRRVQEAMDKARAELATENIDLDKLHVSGNRGGINITTSDDTGKPKAEITPGGDLLVEGRKIEATAEQHALLLQYRRQVEGIASAGMEIGAAGADLGVKAATEALKGIFSGNTDDIEQRVEAEAEKIKASAMKLCDQLPAMLDTQTRLAAAMPEFRPYATLEQSDIDDCYEDDSATDVHREVRAEVQQEVREGIRQGIRGGIQAAAQATGLASSGTTDESGDDASTNAAEEAEAASAETESH